MCQVCGFPICICQPVKMPPCLPCTEDNGCLFNLPAGCVIMPNGITLEEFLQCDNLLNYIYDCLVADDVIRQKYCDLWAGCSGTPSCLAPTNVSVAVDENYDVILTWDMVGGLTYDIYLDSVLITTGASSPQLFHGISSGESHTISVVVHCGENTNHTDITFFRCPEASDFAENVGLSTTTSIYTAWTPVSGVVYDLYQDGVLKQVAATSPHVFFGLTSGTTYIFGIVSKCSGGLNSLYQITVTTA